MVGKVEVSETRTLTVMILHSVVNEGISENTVQLVGRRRQLWGWLRTLAEVGYVGQKWSKTRHNALR